MMRNLVAALSFFVLMAVTGAASALAAADCPPGSSAPECAAPAAPETGPALTASFHGAPEAHNGKKLFAFEIRFGEAFDGLRLSALEKALAVTGGRLVDVKRTVRGENGSVTVRVRPDSSGDLTVTLAAALGGGSLTVPGPTPPAPVPPVVETPAPVEQTPTPLPASVHGAPSGHSGKELFAFEIRFGKAVEGLKLAALKQAVGQALSVTGGRLVDVKRTVRGQNRSVTVRVRPDSSGDVTVTLAGAVGSGTLANPVSFTVPGPSAQQASVPDPEPAHATVVKKEIVEVPPPQVAARVSRGIGSEHPISERGSSVVNMNSFGVWGSHPGISTQGGDTTNNAPDFQVRVAPGPSLLHNMYETMTVRSHYYSYPSASGTSKMKVYLFIRKLGYGTYSGEGGISSGGKSDLVQWLSDGYADEVPFDVRAQLVAQGTAVQPATTAVWNGHVIAAETSSDVIRRGELIGGDARVTVVVGTSSTTAAVSLTNLEATTLTTESPLVPVSYADQTWTGLTVENGGFSQSGTGTGVYREIQGTFRKQNNDGDANTDYVDTVGGIFEVYGTMKGGFVATR